MYLIEDLKTTEKNRVNERFSGNAKRLLNYNKQPFLYQ